MSFELNQQDIREIFIRFANIFQQNKHFLNDLDSKIGDGDHGLSMSRGFNGVCDYLGKNPNLSISEILIKGGMQFNESTGATIGILIYSAMKSAGVTVKGKKQIDLTDLKNILTVSIEAIQKIGNASIGQKTILDSLIPTLEYLESQEKNNNESEIIKQAIKIACGSAESTKKMKSQIGRSRWFKDRCIGVIDPGAYTGYLIIKTIGEYILEKFLNNIKNRYKYT